MPTIARFYGIAIQMYFDDHSPPHFHARYGRARALVRISDGAIISGELPPTAARLVRNWALARRLELEENWRRGLLLQPLERIAGRTTMPEFPMVDVIRLKPLDGRKLWLRFTDGFQGVCDLSDLLAKDGPMVEPLRDVDYFNRVFVEMGAPTWPNGFDIDPIHLYMEMKAAGLLEHVAAA
jgi:hypothetical protein